MDEKKLIERYKQARSYAEMVESEGFVDLLAYVEKEAQSVFEEATLKGYPSASEEHEAILSVRAWKRLIRFCQVKSSKRELYQKKLESLGIKAD